VCALVIDERAHLVTLVGPGGVGKTRLALAAADVPEEQFPQGVRFVFLAPVREPALVLPAVAEALGVRETPTQSLTQQLVESLDAAAMLLILDNFEQVVAAAGRVAELLAACPGLMVLASSRGPLGISWEQLFQVPPLAVPRAAGNPPPEEIGRASAVALFVQQVRTVRPIFALSASNASAVAEICRRLDGLPLAIELAAARMRMLSPEAILAQLRQRPLQLLNGGARDVPARHRALRETIAASYDLLEPEQQALFRRLSVFVGGCTFEAADAIAVDLATPNALEALIDKHLVRSDEAESDEGEVRVRLLETIREFGLEQLEACAETASARMSHARYLVEVAERAAPSCTGAISRPGSGAWRASMTTSAPRSIGARALTTSR
jgi:predicted ATPase